jgi:hypothetical protein
MLSLKLTCFLPHELPFSVTVNGNQENLLHHMYAEQEEERVIQLTADRHQAATTRRKPTDTQS